MVFTWSALPAPPAASTVKHAFLPQIIVKPVTTTSTYQCPLAYLAMPTAYIALVLLKMNVPVVKAIVESTMGVVVSNIARHAPDHCQQTALNVIQATP